MIVCVSVYKLYVFLSKGMLYCVELLLLFAEEWSCVDWTWAIHVFKHVFFCTLNMDSLMFL